MKRFLLFTLLSFAAIGVTRALAHHSVAGAFDQNRRVEVSGVITKVEWINPHTYIHLNVTNDDGSVSTWQLESAPTAMLRKAGLTSEMIISGGALVTATAIMARDGTEHLAWLLRLDYEDGHFYQLSRD